MTPSRKWRIDIDFTGWLLGRVICMAREMSEYEAGYLANNLRSASEEVEMYAGRGCVCVWGGGGGG